MSRLGRQDAVCPALVTPVKATMTEKVDAAKTKTATKRKKNKNKRKQKVNLQFSLPTRDPDPKVQRIGVHFPVITRTGGIPLRRTSRGNGTQNAWRRH